MPENYVHGAPQYFATSMPTRKSAVPLVVKSYDGRPIKIEGNNELPGSNGGTDQYAQASVLSLYDPDRGLNFKIAEGDGKLNVIAKAKVLDQLSGLDNNKTHILMEQSSSPSRKSLVAGLKEKGVRFYEYEPIDFSVHADAASIAFGSSVKPIYKFEKAKAILSFQEESKKALAGGSALEDVVNVPARTDLMRGRFESGYEDRIEAVSYTHLTLPTILLV